MGNKITLTKKTAWLMALALVIAGSIPAAIVTLALAPQVNENTGSIERNEQTNEEIAAAIEKTCQQDHKFRHQYKIRGIAEKKLLAFFLNITANSQEPQTQAEERVQDQFIKEFQPLLDRIHIIPPPNCEQQAQKIRETLNW